MADFVSETFAARALLGPYKRLDIELHGVDQTAPSYEGRIFLNAEDADERTERSPEHGYIGSFYVFGKAGCWGEDDAHCLEPLGVRPFDRRRRADPPAKIRVTVNGDLVRQRLRDATDASLTVVAAVPDRPDYAEFERPIFRAKRIAFIAYG